MLHVVSDQLHHLAGQAAPSSIIYPDVPVFADRLSVEFSLHGADALTAGGEVEWSDLFEKAELCIAERLHAEDQRQTGTGDEPPVGSGTQGRQRLAIAIDAAGDTPRFGSVDAPVNCIIVCIADAEVGVAVVGEREALFVAGARDEV